MRQNPLWCVLVLFCHQPDPGHNKEKTNYLNQGDFFTQKQNGDQNYDNNSDTGVYRIGDTDIQFTEYKRIAGKRQAERY